MVEDYSMYRVGLEDCSHTMKMKHTFCCSATNTKYIGWRLWSDDVKLISWFLFHLKARLFYVLVHTFSNLWQQTGLYLYYGVSVWRDYTVDVGRWLIFMEIDLCMVLYGLHAAHNRLDPYKNEQKTFLKHSTLNDLMFSCIVIYMIMRGSILWREPITFIHISICPHFPHNAPISCIFRSTICGYCH